MVMVHLQSMKCGLRIVGLGSGGPWTAHSVVRRVVAMKSVFVGIALLVVIAVVACGCETREKGTVVGAGTGAVVGGIAGNNIDGLSTVEGAILGGVVGGLMGHQSGRISELERGY